MLYPEQFSPQSRARVEVQRLKASRELEQSLADQSPAAWRKSAQQWDQLAFYAYILRVFLAFVHEACELGKKGIWTVDRIDSEANEFLRRFTIEAYYDKGHDRSGQKFPKMTSNWNGSLLMEVEQEFRKTDEWRQFEDELLAVAAQVAGSTDSLDELMNTAPTVSASAIEPEWSRDLETPEVRKSAREGWKRHWTTAEHECTNNDLTETAFTQKDRPFLNQWENGTVRLKDPSRSSRVRAIERVLRENIPLKWHPAAK